MATAHGGNSISRTRTGRAYCSVWQVVARLVGGFQHLLCDPRVDGDVVLLESHRQANVGDLEQLLQVQRPVKDVVAIQHHEVGARDLDAAVLKYKLLVGDVRDINGFFI